MHKLLLTVLMLEIAFGFAMGDVKCFLTLINDCSTRVGGQSLSGPSAGSVVCSKRKVYFDCIREKEKQCSVHYNLSELEAVTEDMCTNGTFLNKRLLKYEDCIQKSLTGHHSCSQVIIDFIKNTSASKFFEIYKLMCKERHNIHRCLYNHLEEDCDEKARSFIETISKPSEEVNNQICEDVWRQETEKPHNFINRLLQNAEH